MERAAAEVAAAPELAEVAVGVAAEEVVRLSFAAEPQAGFWRELYFAPWPQPFAPSLAALFVSAVPFVWRFHFDSFEKCRRRRHLRKNSSVSRPCPRPLLSCSLPAFVFRFASFRT